MPLFGWGSSSKKDDDDSSYEDDGGSSSDESYSSSDSYESYYEEEEEEVMDAPEKQDGEAQNVMDESRTDESTNEIETSDSPTQEEGEGHSSDMIAAITSTVVNTTDSETMDHGEIVETKGEELVDEKNGEPLSDEVVEEELSNEQDEGLLSPTTSLEDRRGLVALAAEHDRVDILKAALLEQESDMDPLLRGQDLFDDDDKRTRHVPPLHIAISHGSTHATSCLLRMGADPSIRPNLSNLHTTATSTATSNDPDHAPPTLASLRKYHGRTAWELAFGSTSTSSTTKQEEEDKDVEEEGSSKKWFWTSPSKQSLSSNQGKKGGVSPLNIAPSKLEGIRHAFTAEALRAIGSDEIERLTQLIESGLSPMTDIGGRSLDQWCDEMEAHQCHDYLQSILLVATPPIPTEPDAVANSHSNSSGGGKTKEDWLVVHAQDSTTSLTNQVEEMEALSVALSTCLDNLAEEVTVCHGLLLTDTAAGASLASHVKFLKDLTDQRTDDLELWHQKWTHAEHQWLLYASQVAGHSSDDAHGRIDLLPTQAYTTLSMSNNHDHDDDELDTTSLAGQQTEEGEEEQQWKKKELVGQLANQTQKVKKLRASITDLAEELSSNLEQVEQRGLSGGINLTRTLRQELRDVEFQLAQATSGEAICRSKLRQLQKTHNHGSVAVDKHKTNHTPAPPLAVMEDDTSLTLEHSAVEEAVSTEEEGEERTPSVQVVETTVERELDEDQASEGEERGGGDSSVSHSSSTVESFEQVSIQDIGIIPEKETKDVSAAIASGNSMALTIRAPGKRGYLSFGLWELLSRIIGFGSESVRKSAHQIRQSSSPVMIV